jgi:hypothetical protein
MSAPRAVDVAECARNFRITIGSGRCEYRRRQLEPSVQLDTPTSLDDATIASGQNRRTKMVRKLSLAAVAAIALGTAALAPTSASAWGHGGWGHGGWGHGWGHGWGWGGAAGFYGAYAGYGYGGYGYSCRQWVLTQWGYRLRWVC